MGIPPFAFIHYEDHGRPQDYQADEIAIHRMDYVVQAGVWWDVGAAKLNGLEASGQKARDLVDRVAVHTKRVLYEYGGPYIVFGLHRKSQNKFSVFTEVGWGAESVVAAHCFRRLGSRVVRHGVA